MRVVHRARTMQDAPVVPHSWATLQGVTSSPALAGSFSLRAPFFVGAAVDYSRANSAKAAMQAAVNSTALMLFAYFQALFNRTDVSNIAITPSFSSPSEGDFKIDVVGTGQVAASFTKVFGQQTLNINVKSEVLWGIKKLELALALDNTGSMASSSKMTELKRPSTPC